MATVESIAAEALEAGGFEGTAEMHGSVLLGSKDTYYGVISVKKCEVSGLIDTCGESRGAECVFTAAVRCIGAECGYSDGTELDRKIALVCAYLLGDSGCIVRSIVRGELERCAATGRLERILTFTLVGYENIADS